MKKLFCIAMILCLALSIAVSADETLNISASGYAKAGENINPELQTASDGSAASIALKPNDSATAATCWYEYNINIPDGCEKVDFVILYAASGERHMDLTFAGQLKNVTCPDTGDWSSFSTLTVSFDKVTAGQAVLRLAAPADFNNDTIKTPNVEAITVNMKVAEAPAVSPTEEASVEAMTAPQTGDPATVLCVLAIVSFLGFAVIRRLKSKTGI